MRDDNSSEVAGGVAGSLISEEGSCVLASDEGSGVVALGVADESEGSG